MKPAARYLLLLTILGAFLRLLAFQFNEIPHGDIYLAFAAGQNFLEKGRLEIPLIAPRSYLEPRYEMGYPLDQHPPLWPLLGAFGTRFTGDVFATFKVLSFLIGTAMIPTSYIVFGRVFGKKPALLSSTLIVFSYLLIDYSGNGSPYIFHAFLFILAVFFICMNRKWSSFWLGVILGLLYLVNYQSVAAVAALGAVYLFFPGEQKTAKQQLENFLLSLAGMLITISPWLIRNQLLFGNPLFNVSTEYILGALKAPGEIVLVGKYLVKQTLWEQYDFHQIPGLVTWWTIRNLVYFLGRIAVLAPISVVFLPLVTWQHFLRKDNRRSDEGSWFLILVLLFHLLISCLWPVFKFRYFVPMMPLVFALSSYGIFTVIRRTKMQNLMAVSSVVAVIVVSAVTYLRVPSHTNYYDSNEFFHYRTGESEWWTDEQLLIDAAAQIKDMGLEAPILGLRPSLFYHLRLPIVMVNNIRDPQILSWLVDAYAVQYIIDEHDRASYFSGFLNTALVYKNEKYTVLSIQR